MIKDNQVVEGQPSPSAEVETLSSRTERALLPPSGDRGAVEPFVVWSSVVAIGGLFWAAMIWVIMALVL